MPEGKGCLLKLVFFNFHMGCWSDKLQTQEGLKSSGRCKTLEQKMSFCNLWMTAISFSPVLMQCCLLPKITIYARSIKCIMFSSKRDNWTWRLKNFNSWLLWKMTALYIWILNKSTKWLIEKWLRREIGLPSSILTIQTTYMYVGIALPLSHPRNKT